MGDGHITSSRTRGIWLMPVLALLCCACEPPPGDGPGQAEVRVTTPALSDAEVTRVTVTISGTYITPDIVHQLTLVEGRWEGVVDEIPAGDFVTFHAAAYDATETLIYEDTLSGVSVSPSRPVVVLMTLQQKTAPDPFVNTSPVIEGMTISAVQVAPLSSVALSVTAGDADSGDTLTYTWSATGGTYDNSTSTTPHWVAPQTTGTYTLTVTVSDGHGARVSLSVEVTVQT